MSCQILFLKIMFTEKRISVCHGYLASHDEVSNCGSKHEKELVATTSIQCNSADSHLAPFDALL